MSLQPKREKNKNKCWCCFWQYQLIKAIMVLMGHINVSIQTFWFYWRIPKQTILSSFSFSLFQSLYLFSLPSPFRTPLLSLWSLSLSAPLIFAMKKPDRPVCGWYLDLNWIKCPDMGHNSNWKLTHIHMLAKMWHFDQSRPLLARGTNMYLGHINIMAQTWPICLN